MASGFRYNRRWFPPGNHGFMTPLALGCNDIRLITWAYNTLEAARDTMPPDIPIPDSSDSEESSSSSSSSSSYHSNPRLWTIPPPEIPLSFRFPPFICRHKPHFDVRSSAKPTTTTRAGEEEEEGLPTPIQSSPSTSKPARPPRRRSSSSGSPGRPRKVRRILSSSSSESLESTLVITPRSDDGSSKLPYSTPHSSPGSHAAYSSPLSTSPPFVTPSPPPVPSPVPPPVLPPVPPLVLPPVPSSPPPAATQRPRRPTTSLGPCPTRWSRRVRGLDPSPVRLPSPLPAGTPLPPGGRRWLNLMWEAHGVDLYGRYGMNRPRR